MAADALTKPMLSRQLMTILTTGILQVENEEKHHLQMKRLPAKYEILEKDLETDDRTLIKGLSRRSNPATTGGGHLCLLHSSWAEFLLRCFWSPVDFQWRRQKITGHCMKFHGFVIIFVTFAVLMIERLAYKVLSFWHELPGRSSAFSSLTRGRTGMSATTSAAMLSENGVQTDDQPDSISLERSAHEAASRELRRQTQEIDREIEKAKQEITHTHEGFP